MRSQRQFTGILVHLSTRDLDILRLERALDIFASVKRDFEAQHGPLPAPRPA